MAYKRIRMKNSYEIARRWHAGHQISDIARTLGYDRKTVRKTIRLIESQGIQRESPLPDQATFELLIKDNHNHRTPRSKTTIDILLPYKDELMGLVNHSQTPLKPKVAFEVICERHQLTGQVSYPSFKRFYRSCCNPPRREVTCRIETQPGDLLQIDYAKMGLLFDPASGSRRNLYAFIGTLAYSRHKFVTFTFKQDQRSFTASHVHMFESFGGVPTRIALDNLKSGVVKPDLYDPEINRTYQEMAAHYDCFLDPCRVVRPKDKGKVERDVQTIRQQFYKMLTLNPQADLPSLNRGIAGWLKNGYGQKPHGTTGLPPFQNFCQNERITLKPLPATPFEIAVWKSATVHPDNYVQYGKKFFSVPHTLNDRQVWIRATDKILTIYDQRQQIIKQHLITNATRHTDWHDFPENVRAALGENVHRRLIKKAVFIGSEFKKLIVELLEIHAFINLRRAQAIVRLSEQYPAGDLENAAAYLRENKIPPTPKIIKRLLEEPSLVPTENTSGKAEQTPDIGNKTKEFIRPADYFLNP